MISFSFQDGNFRDAMFYGSAHLCRPARADLSKFGEFAKPYPYVFQVNSPDETNAAELVFYHLSRLGTNIKFVIYQNTGSVIQFGQHSIPSETPTEIDWSGDYKQAMIYGNSSPSIGEAVEACVALGMDRQVAANQMANAIAALAKPPKEPIFAVTLPPKLEPSELEHKLDELFELGRACGIKQCSYCNYDTGEIEQKRDHLVADLLAEFGKEKQ